VIANGKEASEEDSQEGREEDSQEASQEEVKKCCERPLAAAFA
jgi:hypothetical protein